MQHELYAITDFKIIGPYTLELVFDDNTKQRINFGPVLHGELLGPLQDQSLFNQVKLDPDAHTIVWPNGADFDPATLHDWHRYEQEIADGIQRQRHAAESQPAYGTKAASPEYIDTQRSVDTN